MITLYLLCSPKIYSLGQLATTELYAENDAYKHLDNYSEIKIVRVGMPLFYLNIETLKNNVVHSMLNENK